MSSTRAYRCPIDATRFAVVHAFDESSAGLLFTNNFPSRPVQLTHLPWEDGLYEIERLDVRQRTLPQSLAAS